MKAAPHTCEEACSCGTSAQALSTALGTLDPSGQGKVMPNLWSFRLASCCLQYITPGSACKYHA